MKIENIKNSVFSKFASGITMVALVLLTIPSNFVHAAAVTAVSDTVSQEGLSKLSRHKIVFTSTSAIAAGNTIAVTFPAGFTTTGLVIADLQICHGPTTGLEFGTATISGGTACASSTETIAASNGASTVWGAVISGTTTITLTAPSGTFTNTITAGSKVTVQIAAAHMQNPASAGSQVVSIATTSDAGNFSIPITDDDIVTISATVNSSITFDLDTYNTSTTTTNTVPLYTVNLGVLTTGAVSGTTEAGGATPNGIWFDLDTNAPGGAIVSVANANGSSGLKSVSTPADFIPSLAGANTASAGTANYGICANRAAQTTGTLTKASPFNGTCTTTPSGNSIVGLTTTPQTIYNTASAPISGGRGEIMVDAAIAGATVAHSDYQDVLTILAVGTF